MEQLISVVQAAAELKVIPRRVRQLIECGELKAQKVGSSYVIRVHDLDAVRVRPKPGRPVRNKLGR